MYAELIEPAVRDSVGAGVSLPYGVEITEDELVGLLRQAAPPEWVDMQAETLIYDVAAYATGGTDGFSTEVLPDRQTRRTQRRPCPTWWPPSSATSCAAFPPAARGRRPSPPWTA